jgi:hypothetical protein
MGLHPRRRPPGPAQPTPHHRRRPPRPEPPHRHRIHSASQHHIRQTNLGPPVRTASAPSRAKPDRARLAAQHPAPGERPPSQHATTGRAPHHIRHPREDPLVLGLGDKRGGPCANRDNLMLSPTKRHRKHHPPPMSIRPSKSPGNPAVLNQRVDQRPGVTGPRDPVRSPTPRHRWAARRQQPSPLRVDGRGIVSAAPPPEATKACIFSSTPGD